MGYIKMVYDLIYNGFLLTSIYFTLDLLNKYNKKEVKTQNDIKIYFATKGILLLDTYNSTKSKICGVLEKCKKQEEDEYKVVILTKSDEIIQCYLCYEKEEYDLNNLVEKYYVSGNVILNKDFIKFIVPEIEDLKEDYKINIIDKEIVMFELNNNNSIEIVDDGYKINKTMKQ